jgi:hypothetical protein
MCAAIALVGSILHIAVKNLEQKQWKELSR